MDTVSDERTELSSTLEQHRRFLLQTVAGLSEEQARSRPCASELTPGGVLKHVTAMWVQWLDFIDQGASAMEQYDVDWQNLPPEAAAALAAEFTMGPDETLQQLLAHFDDVANRAATTIASADLDHIQPLPVAPWFESGASWSVRRVVLHLLAETAQHAGHADILRESIDGQKTMG